MTFEYQTKGVCSRAIHLEIDGDIIRSASFTGGCNGNLKGICSLVKGRTVEEVVRLLEGTTCGNKPTSCPDQLARALKQYQSLAGSAVSASAAGVLVGCQKME